SLTRSFGESESLLTLRRPYSQGGEQNRNRGRDYVQGLFKTSAPQPQPAYAPANQNVESLDRGWRCMRPLWVSGVLRKRNPCVGPEPRFGCRRVQSLLRPSTHNYTNVVDVGNNTSFSLFGLVIGATYFMAVTA